MRFRVCSQTVRHYLPVIILGTLLSGRGLSDDRFPNELNSPVDEPKVSLPDSTVRHEFQASPISLVETSDPLIRLVLDTREAQRRRLLSTEEHTPWQIMHGLLALRKDFVIRDAGRPVSGLDWVSSGPTFRDEFWFEKTRHGGRAHPYSIPYAFEGHINQFLAILSMSGLPLDYELQTATGPITMRDMLRHAQMTVRTESDKEELTWTLWALSRYLPPDAQWKNEKGDVWSIERLVALETEKSLQQPLPCGGTHNVFALAHARNVYLRKGQPLRGVWLKAEHKIRKYIQTARQQQNSNGTLSSNFFRAKEYKKDFDKRMASAGHLLEFLMIALPQEELSEPWVRRAIEATCRDLMDNRHEYVSCSPLYHTVNALSIYLERVMPTQQLPDVAKGQEKTRTISRTKPEPRKQTPPPVPMKTADVSASQQGSGDAVIDLEKQTLSGKLPKKNPPADGAKPNADGSPAAVNPTEPAPTEPAPTEPTPTEPTPTEPTPTEPTPTEPTPTEPTPTEPTPTEPTPTEPTPTEPTPTEPTPAEPAPAEPAPAGPTPAEPTPAEPAPAEPAPAGPTPAGPTSMDSASDKVSQKHSVPGELDTVTPGVSSQVSTSAAIVTLDEILLLPEPGPVETPSLQPVPAPLPTADFSESAGAKSEPSEDRRKVPATPGNQRDRDRWKATRPDRRRSISIRRNGTPAAAPPFNSGTRR